MRGGKYDLSGMLFQLGFNSVKKIPHIFLLSSVLLKLATIMYVDAVIYFSTLSLTMELVIPKRIP